MVKPQIANLAARVSSLNHRDAGFQPVDDLHDSLSECVDPREKLLLYSALGQYTENSNKADVTYLKNFAKNKVFKKLDDEIVPTLLSNFQKDSIITFSYLSRQQLLTQSSYEAFVPKIDPNELRQLTQSQQLNLLEACLRSKTFFHAPRHDLIPKCTSFLRYKLLYLLSSLPDEGCTSLLDGLVSEVSDLNPELKKLAYLGLLSLAPQYNFYKGMKCRKAF